jgi:dTDP-glucose pyrophosphorylase
MNMSELEKYQIRSNISVKDAIKKLDEGGIGIIVVVDDIGKVVGVVSDGDFRRSVLTGVGLDAGVLRITNKKFRYLNKGYSKTEATNFFKMETGIERLLVLDNGKLSDIITEKDFDAGAGKTAKLDNPVVIMAGGKGIRMEPFTRILPKPLIPIGDKTIIELIMDKYMEYGIDTFIISVNYKAKMIKSYFEDEKTEYKISYIDELEPLGTAGSLKYLGKILKRPFFVSNCDVIINDKYNKILDFHNEGRYDLTLVASLKSHVIPYGVCEIDKNGALTRLIEKPESSLLVNAGMYILTPDILESIPSNTVYHMTDVIDGLRKQGRKVGVYPISENSWIDIGQWELYQNAINIFPHNR